MERKEGKGDGEERSKKHAKYERKRKKDTDERI